MSQEKIEQLEKDLKDLRLKHREVVAFCFAHIKTLKKIQELCDLWRAGESGTNGDEQVIGDIKKAATEVLVMGLKSAMAEYDAQQKANELALNLAAVNRRGGFNRLIVDDLVAILGEPPALPEGEKKHEASVHRGGHR